MQRSRLLVVLALASGCHLVFPIEPQGETDAGTTGAAPRVFSSPGPAASLYGGYPKSFAITLAADEPGTTIYYTTDGSMPDMTSASSATPLKGITISANTMVRYFGVFDGVASDVASEMFSIDAASAQSNAGYLVTNVTLDGTSPVVIAARGAVLAAKASVQTWVQSNCAACAAQVVYGVDDMDQGCLFDGGPGVYPGNTVASKSFNVRAPMTPGVHEVKLAHIEQTSCAAAMAARSLATRPTLARIGVIIVR
jgi:hypothetical protein